MIWICFAVLILTIALSALSLRSRRGDALGLPLVAIGSFAFLYVVEPIAIIEDGVINVYLTEQQTIKAILIPAVMLACFIWGWMSLRQEVQGNQKPAWNGRRMWIFGFATALAGLVLDLVFLNRSGGILYSFSQAHGGAMAYVDNTAYLYNGPWWMLSGSVMMILGCSKPGTTGWKRLVPLAFLALLLVSSVLTGARGMLFSTVASGLVSYSLVRRRVVPLSRAFAALAILGFGVLLVLGYRGVLHLGEQSQATPTLAAALETSTGASETVLAHRLTGQEFIYHAAVLDTVDRTGKLDYGLDWIYFLAINPIPKLVWPGKHYPDSPGVTGDDIHEHTGATVAFGSATGLVADLYREFGLIAAPVLYLFGRFARKLLVSARRLELPLSACAYVMLYALSLNLFAQDVRGVLVPFFFSLAPMVLFTWFAGQRRQLAYSTNTHITWQKPQSTPQTQIS